MNITLISICLLATIYASAQNQSAPAIPLYGEAVTLELAKKILAASEVFAKNKQWPVAIAIVDTGGNLVMFSKLDNTQVGSIDVAIGKAKTANNFKRATKSMEDAVAGGGAGLRLLAVPGVFPMEGGEPIFVNGKIIGAIGVSGVQPGQDAEVARAGLAALK